MTMPETPHPNSNVRNHARVVAVALTVWALASSLACNQVQDLGEQGDGGSKPPTTHPGKDGGDGGVSGGDGDMSGGDGDEPPVQITPVTLTAKEVCMQLLTCSDHQTPSQFAQFFPIYGTNGSCWGEHSEQECRQGCVDALRTLYQAGTEGCKYCDDDTSCPQLPNTGHAGVCHPSYHECSECATDEDCTSEYSPVCSLTYNRCVECGKDADCDVAECSIDANTCNGYYCEEHFNKFVTLTLRGTGLEQFEEGNHLSYDLYETLDGCGTSQYDSYLHIVNGGFEIVRDDIVATNVTLVVDIWQDGVGGFKYLREGVDLTKNTTIELHAEDFMPKD
jgi:hypothetical protein